MVSIIPKRRVWFTCSGLLVLGSLAAIGWWGLRFGIDFTGGSLLELQFSQKRPSVAAVREIIQTVTKTPGITVQSFGERGMTARFPHVTQAIHQQLLERVRANHPDAVEARFDTIGPAIGDELRKKTVWAIGVSVVGMILFISFAFRKVTRPVPSWQYGTIAIVALLHDLVITTGAFAVFGRLYGIEVNAPFVAALLTVFGYSVNDTIVVFDRIRDNLLHHGSADFSRLVESSVQQTMVRSTSTSLATLLALLSILAFGGDTVRDFALTLIIGIAVGTYSSIFIASPLLVVVQHWRKKR